MPTPDLGCLTNSTNINNTTMHGNKSTTPRGIEMLELPRNRNGRRKNANLEVAFVFVFTSSNEGRFGDEGRRFQTLCTNPIDAVVFAVCSKRLVKGDSVAPARQWSVRMVVGITIMYCETGE